MPDTALKTLRILIVDGEPEMRILTRDTLNSLGVEQVFTVADGGRAYALLQERSFDLILTERKVEPLDGIEMTRLIRTASDSPDPHIPILMMTAAPSRRDVFEARDAGVNEFLVKPFSADGLAKRIAATVANPRAFIEVESYFGPDRRRVERDFPGEDMRRRKARGRGKPRSK